MKQPKTYFTVNADRRPRKLFSFELDSDGGITLVMPRIGYHREHVNGQITVKSAPVAEHHISIHATPPDKFRDGETHNCISHTKKLADGTKVMGTKHWTQASKTTRQFAPVHFVRCFDLTMPQHDIILDDDLDCAPVNLDTYNPWFFQFVYGVLVSHASRRFVMPPTASGVKIHQEMIGDFNLVILWSYLGLRSDGTQDHNAFRTYSDRDITRLDNVDVQKFLVACRDGFDEAMSFNWFHGCEQELLAKYFEFWDRISPGDFKPTLSKMRRFAAFFADGEINSPEYEQHVARIGRDVFYDIWRAFTHPRPVQSPVKAAADTIPAI
jgi:hypothetical protein